MRLIGVVLGVVFLLASHAAQASRSSSSSFHVFAATGRLLGLSSVRVGVKSFEIGKLGPEAFGLGKILNFGGAGIVTFGPSFSSTLLPGVYGSVGWQPHLFSIFSFRTELMAANHWKGVGTAEVLVGLSANF